MLCFSINTERVIFIFIYQKENVKFFMLPNILKKRIDMSSVMKHDSSHKRVETRI